MNVWFPLLAIFAAGAIGGLANLLLAGDGFHLPKYDPPTGIYLPGFLGNIAIGGIAAIVSWGLYGPFSSTVIIGAGRLEGHDDPGVTLASLVGAILVGTGGARWLASEVDKRLFRSAAAEAAAKPQDANASKVIAASSGIQALAAVRNMRS
jgi:hypothetical protein